MYARTTDARRGCCAGATAAGGRDSNSWSRERWGRSTQMVVSEDKSPVPMYNNDRYMVVVTRVPTTKKAFWEETQQLSARMYKL